MAQMHRKPANDYAFRLPWIEGDAVVEWEPDQRLLTRRYTEAAVAFIDEHADRPFFVYVPHSMPHIPIYTSPAFEGGSSRGLYGDVIEELDWSVGQLVAALERHGVLEDTLVIFTSDNGPWLPFGDNGGSAGLLRGGKGSNWEGGQRVPCVVSWPGRVPAGSVVREVLTAMDVLPTVARFAGASLAAERALDGHDVGDLLLGRPGARAPNEHFVYYTAQGALAGVRRGPWKLLLGPGELYQIEHDVSEARDVAAQHPELVRELRALAFELDAEISAGARPTRRVEQLLFDPAHP
jgi:arylsulfatase A-like enzyme